MSRRRTQAPAPGKCRCCQVTPDKCGKTHGKGGKVQPRSLDGRAQPYMGYGALGLGVMR